MIDDAYRTRMRRALLGSLLLHALLLIPFAEQVRHGGPGIEDKPEPIVLRLDSPDPKPPRQLVDVTQPSETLPSPKTDLIAEQNSIASDTELRAGEALGPQVEEEDSFDQLAALRPAAPPAPQPIPPQPDAAEAEQPEQPKPETVQETPPEEPEPEPEVVETPPPTPETWEQLAAATPRVPRLPPVQTPPAPPLERIQRSQQGTAEFGSDQSTGRKRDGVQRKGMTNFEAIEDEMAPYLKELRRRVERRWSEALLSRYSGSIPTEAMIDCAIAPDGTLVSATIIGNPRDRIFAALCRDAIQRAAPFGPFTFEVPDIYRDKNLEIRWTFSFM